MEIKIKSLETINDAATEFVKQMGDNTVFAFHGEMGAGKTTFLKNYKKLRNQKSREFHREFTG